MKSWFSNSDLSSTLDNIIISQKIPKVNTGSLELTTPQTSGTNENDTALKNGIVSCYSVWLGEVPDKLKFRDLKVSLI